MLDTIIDLLKDEDEICYMNTLCNTEFANFTMSNRFTTLKEFYWENKHNERFSNLDAGPANTAALLHKYRDDVHGTYVAWISAIRYTIENKNRNGLPDGWAGQPFRFLEDLHLDTIDKFGWEFEYHSSCTNVLPGPLFTDMYRPTSEPYLFVKMVANIIFYNTSMWLSVRRVFE